MPGTLLKVIPLHGRFSRLLNCTNGTKSLKASQMRMTGYSKTAVTQEVT